jgi:thiol:disulfide interchange protein DsbD
MRLLLLVLVSALLAVWLFSANGEDFLAPEAAFPVTTNRSAETLTVHVDIQEGYYLYRDKIRLLSQDLVLEATPWPEAIEKNDPLFGDVAIYQKPLTFTWQIKGRQTEAETANITFEYQGCSEAGLCYPPQRLTFPMAAADLPVVAATVTEKHATTTPSAATRALLRRAEQNNRPNFGLAGDALLAPEEAFVPSVIAEPSGQLAVFWRVQPGYYLYQKSLEIQSGRQTLAVAWDKPYEKDDPYFGKVFVYEYDFSGKILDVVNEDTLTISFQGCAENFGVCYPTVSQTVSLPTAILAAHRDFLASSAFSRPPVSTPSEKALSETDSLSQGLAEKSFLINILIFFGLGLLLSLTPCVFPMIPILSGIIAGQKALSAWRGFSLSLVYVLGMALTYTALGVAMALLGAEANLQAALQNPWVLGGFALVFVLLALSMFGLYDLQLPPSWQAAFSNASNRLPSGNYLGVTIMGVLSALIVGPCVAAPLAGALLYISQSGDVILGGSALFAMSLGMGLPLLLIGASAGHWLPKAGAWMNATKAVFGVLLLGVGIWLISRVLPSDITLLLWAALFLGSGVYLGAFSGGKGWQRLRQTLGIALLLFAITLFLGAATGGKSLWPPLAHLTNKQSQSLETLSFQVVKTEAELKTALQNSQGQKTLLDFTADWCIACKELAEITFKDSRVQAALKNYQLLQVDLSQQTPESLALLKNFGLFGPPALLFFNAQGQELRPNRIIGFVSPEKFLSTLP